MYHLGDIIYTLSGSETDGSEPVKPYSHSLWDDQFFDPYAKFPKKIFSIAGNHDGKYNEKIMALRDYLGSVGAPLHFFVFDLLILSGKDVMGEPLVKRRELLEKYVLPKLDEPIRFSPILKGRLKDLVHSVKTQRLEV